MGRNNIHTHIVGVLFMRSALLIIIYQWEITQNVHFNFSAVKSLLFINSDKSYSIHVLLLKN